MTEPFDDGKTKGGFEVECPCCKAVFVARRPVRPFVRATPESVARVPPDVRNTPKYQALAVAKCEHCGQDYRPARGSHRPRFCSKSCARRNALARKHGFIEQAT